MMSRRLSLAPLLVAVATVAATGWGILAARSDRSGRAAPATTPLAQSTGARRAGPAPFTVPVAPAASTPATTHRAPPLPDTEVGHRIRDVFAVAATMGPDAEARYQAALAQLRQSGDEAVSVLADAYGRAPARAFEFRWKAIDTLAMLDSRAALDPLRDFALAPLPAEAGDGHQTFTRGDEAALRMAAVNGLARLARAGDQAADEALLRVVAQSDSTSARKHAAAAYLNAAVDDRAARAGRVRPLLPPEMQRIVDHPVTSIEEAIIAGRTTRNGKERP